MLVNPEKLCQAIQLKIPDDLIPFLLSEDSYMRKKTAKIYSTISRHVNGRQFILENKIFLNILKQKINDSDASVRYFIALTIQNITLDLYSNIFKINNVFIYFKIKY